MLHEAKNSLTTTSIMGFQQTLLDNGWDVICLASSNSILLLPTSLGSEILQISSSLTFHTKYHLIECLGFQRTQDHDQIRAETGVKLLGNM